MPPESILFSVPYDVPFTRRGLNIMRAAAVTAICLAAGMADATEPPPTLRIGIIGCDTSHVKEFTNLLHGPKAKGDLADFRVVAAFPGGSQDIPSSRDRVAGYTAELRDKHKVEIVDSIPKMLEKVDVVLLES